MDNQKYLISMVRDISGRKQMEAQLRIFLLLMD
jgi:hypothetical protein